MRTWFVTLAVATLGAALVLPAEAQQKSGGADKPETPEATENPAPAGPEMRVVRNAFALP